MDLIKQLGPLAFASRLKRLSERLQKDASRIYKDHSVNIEARWFPVLYALKQESALSVTALAEALRLTHPAINQIAGDMARRGLIKSKKDSRDERRRMLSLSAKGRKALRDVDKIWKEISYETKQILKIAGNDVLSALENIENSLDEKSMYERISERLKKTQMSAIEILDYKPGYKKYFASLNREWLNKYFKIEKYDQEMLSDPNSAIIKPGGFILFAKLDGKIVGTVALKLHAPNVYELTKMAVAEEARGRQVGRRLLEEALAQLRRRKAKTVLLQTSPKLKPAIALYKKYGFSKTRKYNDQFPEFKRETFTMVLNLTKRT